jgi:large subunit ribosomal protein L17
MRHRKFTFKIGRSSAHVRSLLANAVCSLIKHKRITTTLVKAKQLRVLADQMMTLGKTGTLHARRQAIAKLHQVDVVRTLFDELAPQYMKRNGGYTRIMKLGPRIGDAAEMAILEFVEPDNMVASRAKITPVADSADAATVPESTPEANTEETKEEIKEEAKEEAKT